MTLGRLIKILSCYCQNKELFTAPEKFSTLRNDVIHRILDKDVKDLERRTLELYPKFFKLMENFVDEKVKLIEEYKNIPPI